MRPISVGNTRVWQHKHVEELQIAPDQTTNGQPNLALARVYMYMTCFLYEVICFEVICIVELSLGYCKFLNDGLVRVSLDDQKETL